MAQEQTNQDNNNAGVATSNVIAEMSEVPKFGPGDTVRIHYKIVEGDKTRVQPYEGIVISIKGEGLSKTFMVRKIGADGVGVERIFPLFSPNIEKLEIVKKGKVRRAKLYYMRTKKGRAASRVKQAHSSRGIGITGVEVEEAAMAPVQDTDLEGVDNEVSSVDNTEE